MSRFLREALQPLSAYTPGEQPRDGKPIIKLNTNESPFPPSPGTLAMLADAENMARLNLYPDPQGLGLRSALAARYGVAMENVSLGNGSDELLAFAFMAYCGAGRPAAYPDITYGLYPVLAGLYGVQAEIRPLNAGFAIDPADYSGGGYTLFLANPNAVTGRALEEGALEQILRANPNDVVVVDEAYVDFGCASAIPLTKAYDNLLVIQTYSKSRSLAGLRVGFAIGSAPLIADMEKIRCSFNPYNLSRLGLLLGEAALAEDEYYQNNCRTVAETRVWTVAQLDALGYETVPSLANYVLTRRPGVTGQALYDGLRARGLLVRHFKQARVADYVRVTIGSQAQMAAFIAAAGEIE